jgi:hypothetical protein
VLTKLLFTGDKHRTLFEFTNFKFPSYDYDFSRADKGASVSRKHHFWNGQHRNSKAMTYFDAFESKLNGQDFDTLLELPQIFVNIVSDDQKEKANKNDNSAKKKNQSKETNKFLLEELKLLGKDELSNYIVSKLTALNNGQEQNLRKEKQTIFKFLIKKIDLTMTTLNLEPFLHAHLENLRMEIHLMGGINNTYRLSMQRIEIVKCKDNSTYDLSRNTVLQKFDRSEENLIEPYSKDKDTAVLRIMYDDRVSTEEKDPSRQLEEIDTRGGRASPNTNDKRRKKAYHGDQYKYWSKGALNLEQTVYQIDAKGLKNARESGLNPKWNVINSLEISTKPMAVVVDLEILKFFREYVLVREWNNILKVKQKKDDQVERVKAIYQALHN